VLGLKHPSGGERRGPRHAHHARGDEVTPHSAFTDDSVAESAGFSDHDGDPEAESDMEGGEVTRVDTGAAPDEPGRSQFLQDELRSSRHAPASEAATAADSAAAAAAAGAAGDGGRSLEVQTSGQELEPFSRRSTPSSVTSTHAGRRMNPNMRAWMTLAHVCCRVSGMSDDDFARELEAWTAAKAIATDRMEARVWDLNGALVRSYDSLVAFDFQNSDPEWAAAHTGQLLKDVDSAIGGVEGAATVRLRRTRIEVVPRYMSKAALTKYMLQLVPDADYALAMGDDSTDEDVFTTLRAQANDDNKEDDDTAAAAAATGAAAASAAVSASSSSSSPPRSPSFPPMDRAMPSAIRKVTCLLVGKKKSAAHAYLPRAGDARTLLELLADSLPDPSRSE
jgi:trehalose-6-phosphatase